MAIRSITAPQGFRAAGGAFGIKASGKPDLALIIADEPCRAAAVFTQSAIPSEAVQVGRQHLKSGKCQAIVCNAGVANASTGKQGMANAKRMCRQVADHLGCEPQQVLACSTGVIGRQLPIERICSGIDALMERLSQSGRADLDAANAILTTDLVPKPALREVTIGGTKVMLGGIAKGSGMIAPNMATMLAFITTDADIYLPQLRAALKDAVNADASFNRISVDTDTSPSDTVAILASGQAGHPPIRGKSKAYEQFAEALADLCRDLAYQVVADGEGATKILRVQVSGARSDADAQRVGRAVVESPLVKTAVHGGDPNWGRLTMAVGKSGAAVAANKLVVRIGTVEVYRNGQPVDADEGTLEALMRQKEVTIGIDLHQGNASTEWLGCDLSRDYITINADYRT